MAAARPAQAATIRQREGHHRPGTAAGEAPCGGRRRCTLALGASSLSLPQAIHMETDPQTVSAYLVYLSQHTPVEEQAQHSDLALVRGWGQHSDLAW